jgi:diacylglycerol kinase (ATP)
MSLQRRIDSFRYAFQGVAELFRSQPNARIHLVVAALVVVAGRVLKISTTEWAVIVLCMALVLALEAVNTALEFLTDLVSPEHHPLAGKAKDVAAAAVLLAACGSVVVGLLILGPRLWVLLWQVK